MTDGRVDATTDHERFFRACLLILGGILALWVALELLARFRLILLVSVIVLVLCAAVYAYRYWWGGR